MSKQHLEQLEIDIDKEEFDEFAQWLKQAEFKAQGRYSKCIDSARFGKWAKFRKKLPQILDQYQGLLIVRIEGPSLATFEQTKPAAILPFSLSGAPTLSGKSLKLGQITFVDKIWEVMPQADLVVMVV